MVFRSICIGLMVIGLWTGVTQTQLSASGELIRGPIVVDRLGVSLIETEPVLSYTIEHIKQK